MSGFVLTADAREDLRQIRDYVLAQGGTRAARYVVQTIADSFRQLSRSPHIGHIREDLTDDPDVRFWSVFSYLVVYLSTTRPLTIIAIVHGRRDVAQFLGRRVY
jgi:toxin ParE1/3/4